ncbi:hypothetical protein CJF42_24335, partial [Pseudoalteromonas sp. NBT06-2]|uniref:DUF4277 domain-containing protein n=1 Tax=Pseudoalteromonas sp. NBT06-2 TaxID=2025950 RepID=UPI000BD3F579
MTSSELFNGNKYIHITTRDPPLANVQIQHLDHLGLVAVAIDSLKLNERIDKRLPLSQNSDANLTHGQRVKA